MSFTQERVFLLPASRLFRRNGVWLKYRSLVTSLEKKTSNQAPIFRQRTIFNRRLLAGWFCYLCTEFITKKVKDFKMGQDVTK